MAGVTRHFVTIGDRQVHYLRAGAGPCVVLLHGSPESGFSLLPLLQVLKDEFTVIAPDTPGNGNSDPLPLADPEIPDYAAALRDLFDALGIDKAALYGFHTGADIAVSLSTQYPERAAMVIANGFPIFTELEIEEILANYLPPFEPRWDGGHLVWLWARMVEQLIFFPWHKRDAAHRMIRDNAPPEFIQFWVLQALRSGDEWRKPYRAAFRQRSQEFAPRMKAPTILTALESDPIFSHLDRLPALPKCARVERLGPDFGEAFAAFARFFREHKAPAAAPAPPVAARRSNPITQDFIHAGGGQVYYQMRPGSGRPIVALHDPASSCHVFDSLLANRKTTRPIYAIDLPGNGESDNTFPGGIPTLRLYAQKLAEILAALEIKEIDVVGYHSGGAVGAELAATRSDLVKSLVYVGAAVHDAAERAELVAHYTPDISPRWDGTHLITAWRMMRQQSLYWPWFKMTADAVVPGDPHLDNAMLQRRVVDLMKCGNTYQHAYRALFEYDAVAGIRGAPCRTWIGFLASHPLRDYAVRIAQATGKPTTEMPGRIADWGPHVETLFAD